MSFTKEEVKKILKNASLDDFINPSISQNNAICQGLLEAVCAGDDYYNAVLGFVLGVAAGKHIERNRTADNEK